MRPIRIKKSPKDHLYKFKVGKTVYHIELEFIDFLACEIRYYAAKHQKHPLRYQMLTHNGTSTALLLLRACLDIYQELDGEYAMIYSAANDIDDFQEGNRRHRVYEMFIEREYRQGRFPEYETMVDHNSYTLSTMLLIQEDHPHVEEVLVFYEDFKHRVRERNESGERPTGSIPL